MLHEVGATDLKQTLAATMSQSAPLLADCICFNFPHHPGKGRIARNRALVRDFLVSAVPQLSSSGHIRVSLAARGTPFALNGV